MEVDAAIQDERAVNLISTQVDAQGAIKVRRWDAGEDDRAQGALAARVSAVWKSKVHGALVLNRRVDLYAIDDFQTGPRRAVET